MIHLFVNALAASAGGGLTYVHNIVPHLSARHDVRTTLLVNSEVRRELAPRSNVEIVDGPACSGAGIRFLFEQRSLAGMVRSSGVDVLVSTGNFALRNSPVPQILLSRNALYTCDDFYHDLRKRREYRLWVDTRLKARLAKRSIETADVTVAPSQAFAEELRQWTGKNVVAIHHGFDAEAFCANDTALSPALSEKLGSTHHGLRLLFVSHYNYYRNFETLIRAMGLAVSSLGGAQLQLILTCRLRSEDNPGSYRAEPAARLVDDLGLRSNIVELGSVDYSQLHHVYRACDIYVTPAYCESFAHPLVEAMWSALPIIAADLPVHREVCGDAALYFPRFSSEALAETIAKLSCDQAAINLLRDRGIRRATDFSWAKHVDDLLRVSRRLIAQA